MIGNDAGERQMHGMFIRAARDFYDSGKDNFSPDYDCYGDLLVAAEAFVRAITTPASTGVLVEAQALVKRLRSPGSGALWGPPITEEAADMIEALSTTPTPDRFGEGYRAGVEAVTAAIKANPAFFPEKRVLLDAIRALQPATGGEA